MEAWQRVQVDQRQDARSVISGFAVEFYLWVEMSLANEVLDAAADPLRLGHLGSALHPLSRRGMGRPVHDDRHFFEMLILEGAQAGLSWIAILADERGVALARSDRFDPKKVAKYDARKRRTLLADAGIVRNRARIDAAIGNARAFLDIQKEFGSFDAYVWRFVGGRPIVNRPRTHGSVPPRTTESDALSRDLRERGFKFVGSTICYAFMQATGLVDDHLTTCFLKRRSRVRSLRLLHTKAFTTKLTKATKRPRQILPRTSDMR